MVRERTGAVVVGAGSGRRFGADKVFATLGDRPVLAYAVETLEQCAEVTAIVVVLAAENVARGLLVSQERNWTKVSAVCAGGARRQDSVREGLGRLEGCSWVVVHDGARPFLTPQMVQDGLAVARQSGAAVAAVPAKDTIKLVGRDGLIVSTPERDRLWQVQTPQVFRYDRLCAVHTADKDDATDDATLFERQGWPVAVFPGSYENIKITTPEDLAIAHCLLGLRPPHKQAPA